MSGILVTTCLGSIRNSLTAHAYQGQVQQLLWAFLSIKFDYFYLSIKN